MSIHHCHSPENVGSAVSSVVGGIGQAAMAAWILSRQETGRRDADAVAAAEGARAGVLRSTVHGLREQLAEERHEHREEVLDLRADADFFRGENCKLAARIAQLEGALVRMDGDCRTLADALRKSRAA